MEERRLLFLCLLFAVTWTSSAGLATMSVDLSNEFIKIAIVKPGVPMEIVLNTESQRKTPLALAFRNGERFFGEAAWSTCGRAPKSCFVYFLDLLGKNTSHELVQLYHQRFPQYDLVDDPVSKRVVYKLDDGTQYAPEELLAMVLRYSKLLAEKYAENLISDAVITVPPFFTQNERLAVSYAAKLAGLNLLQLLNDNTAAAVNYGVFRRKEMSNTTQYIMLYDMGASSTTATVVGYHMTKLKDTDGKAFESAQLVVKGTGFDRTLGGLEIDLRLREHFIKKFGEQSKKDAWKNPQALVKLLKEATRVKRILSANTETNAQVESLMDDVDFKTKITRAELESMCADVFERVGKVVEQAVSAADMSLGEIPNVIVVGGGTRIPKVQDELMTAVKRTELGKSLNSDEAVALGAVYQAAHLSKGFRVQPLDIIDGTVFPIIVEFERGASSNTETEVPSEATSKIVKRVLFGRSNGYPQRKVLTFPKHSADFSFDVKYGDLDFLPAIEHSYAASGLRFTVSLQGVSEAFAKHTDKRPKGVKAHFRVDSSGIFELDHAEATFEHEKEEEVPSTIEKISQSITNFFSGSLTNTSDDNATQAEAPSQEINAATGLEGKENVTENSTESAGKVFTVTKVNKTVTVKEKLKDSTMRLDLADYPDKDRLESRKRLNAMDDKDREKQEKEKARNTIESYVFHVQNIIYESKYEKASTENERESILKVFREASEWLEEESGIQAADVYKKKMKTLEDAMKDLQDRVTESERRPRVLEDLKKHLNTSRAFLQLASNNSLGLYTEAEIDVLHKLINETEAWQEASVKQQNAAALTAAPVFRVADIVEKIRALDREVKYLLNKAKFAKPKPKPESKKKDTKKDAGKKRETVIENVTEGASSPDAEPDLEQEYTIPLDEKMSQENLHVDDTVTGDQADSETSTDSTTNSTEQPETETTDQERVTHSAADL
ncbi:HSP70-3 [Ramazzottius varieornatus]|uniref:Hypoxia up-regulated protein 1 n=1 Tax=Ramazzottius varieornatus TaxID=947166 RepID=A0A1D1UYQ6_RAMVA|nr:HSP70-3 [Ramazzottius varieornatus]